MKQEIRTHGSIQYDTTLHLGTGSLGTKVYRGIWERRPVAVKVLLRQMISDCKIDQEIEMLLKLDAHPNIVRYFRKESTPEFVLIALELCSTNLNDFITKDILDLKSLEKPVRYAKLIDLLKQTTEGLSYLHEKRIIHNDLKPANILLAYLGVNEKILAKISDFGISREVGTDKSYLRVVTTGAGTADWMAPEIISQFDEWDEVEVPELRMVTYI